LNSNSTLYTEFSFGIIPADEKAEESIKMANTSSFRLNLEPNGVYYTACFSLIISDYIDESTAGYHIINTKHSVYFDEYDGVYSNFGDRKSAIKFKKFLIDLFNGEFEYGENQYMPHGVKEIFMVRQKQHFNRWL
jgi:hypothetical protein